MHQKHSFVQCLGGPDKRISYSEFRINIRESSIFSNFKTKNNAINKLIANFVANINPLANKTHK